MSENFLIHYGVAHDENPPGRGSGRFEFGSGENPGQHPENMTLAQQKSYYMKKYNGDEAYVAQILGYKNSNDLRNAIHIEKAKAEQAKMDAISKLYFDKDNPIMSPTKIEKLTGIPEGTVRSYIKKFGKETKLEADKRIGDQLKELVNQKKVLDVGSGVEYALGISETRKDKIIDQLKAEGYEVLNYYQTQLATGKNTTVQVLCPPGTTYEDMKAYVRENGFGSVENYIVNEDGSRSILNLPPVQSVDLDRILIRYKEDGGTDMDGTIEIKRGPEDISLGAARYAQVRIGVDGKYYLKGVAFYGKDEDFPPGKDIIFNSSKSKDLPIDKVLKKMKTNVLTGEIDQDNPFGASIKTEDELVYGRRKYTDPVTGEEKISAINIVNEQGDWVSWTKSMPSQSLSKQSEALIKQQLNLAYIQKVDELSDIRSISNESVRRVMLENFFESCDRAAVDLKGAAFPRQQTHLLIPINSLKEGECYAPNYQDGEEVVLFRYPHQGRFEIPKLTVNNNNKDGKRIIGNAGDAIGITHDTANQLSGADFDGDTVTVIPLRTYPNSSKYNQIKTDKAIKELWDFEPKAPRSEGGYAIPPDDNYVVKKDPKFDTQMQMGIVSNLITDMTLKDAPTVDIIKATRHALVVIDAEKHNLDWRRSEVENDIADLKKRYQNGGGASTLISRAKSPVYVDERRINFKVDAETGAKITFDTHATKLKPKRGKWTGEYDDRGKKIYEETGEYEVKNKTQKSTKMAEAKDARELLSDPVNPNPKEVLYANYANNLKALANTARLEWSQTPTSKKDIAASKVYKDEVEELDNIEVRLKQNRPKERLAQQRATNNYYKKLKERDDLEDEDRKKIRNQCLAEARNAVGADKNKVVLTPKLWEAIENHAISGTKAETIIRKVDSKQIMQYALPKNSGNKLSTAKVNRIKTLYKLGYAPSQIAEEVGVSPTTVNKYVTPASKKGDT